MSEHLKHCRAILEYFVDEYVEVGKEWFLNETMCPHKMLVYKKLAKMVCYAHEAYHIAIELEHGTERDWHGDHAHTHKAMPDHSMPRKIHDYEAWPDKYKQRDHDQSGAGHDHGMASPLVKHKPAEA